MKQIEWENSLLEKLKPLGDEERFKIAEYYREIYADKLEAGEVPDLVLAEFGEPEECARKILLEAKKDEDNVCAVEEKKGKQKWTPSILVGMSFLTLLLILPLAGCAVAVIAVFGACCITGGALVLGGGIYAVVALFFGSYGMEAGGIMMHCGMGIASVGIGFLMCVGFYYATKYTIIACVKALRWVYGRGEV